MRNHPLNVMGAHHAVEIPFVFHNNEEIGMKYDEVGKKVEEQIHRMCIKSTSLEM